jgi:hypothetical protein
MTPVKYATPQEPEWEERTGRHWGCGEKQEDCECPDFEVVCAREENDEDNL